MEEIDDTGEVHSEHSTIPDEQWTQVAQRHFEPGGTNELTVTIISAIAEAKGVPPTELKSPKLYDLIDAPALEDTFFGPDVGTVSRRGIGSVQFRYARYLVTVSSDGWVQVYRPTGTDRSQEV